MKKYQGTLGTSADALVRALVAQSDLGRTIARIYVYISLKADADLRVAANQEKQAQAIDLYTAFGEAVSWVAPEILRVGEAQINCFIAADDTLGQRFDFFLPNVLPVIGSAPCRDKIGTYA